VVDKISPLGIFLIIKVEEYPRLSQVIVSGNNKISTDNINKGIGKNRGDILNPYDVYLSKQTLKKLYQKEGLMFAKIEAESVPTDTPQYNRMIFDIVEGPAFYVSQIEFIGDSLFTDKELASSFKDTKTKSWWEFWKSSKFDLTEYEKDKELLKKYFKKSGFVDAELIKDTLLFDEANEEVKVRLTITEGKKLYVRNINFEGNTVYKTDQLLKHLDFKKGDAYDLERFEANLNHNEDQTDVTSLYADNGYLAIRFVPEETRIQPDSVDLLIKTFENQRVKIRRVDIVGNTKTKDKVVRRELYTRPGDYFDRSAVIRSVRALGLMQYFNPETLRPDVKPVDDGNVDVVYKVEEKSTDQVSMSLGFAGTFGLTGSLGLMFNNFSISEPFSGGAGQVLNFNAEFGQANRYQTFTLGFTEPWLFDQPTSVGFNLFYNWVRYYDYNIRRRGAAFNIGRRFRWPDDYWRGDWGIRVQENYVPTESLTTYYRKGLTNEITLSQSFSRTSMNNQFFPTVGSRFSFSTQFAMGAINLGTVDFLKNQLKFEMVHPLLTVNGNDRLVLYMGTNLGFIEGLKSDTTINMIELYMMGGNGLSGIVPVTPLRGYTDHSIGIMGSNNTLGGGKAMIKHTIELRYAISLEPPIYFYGFAEAGNVWKDLQSADPFDLKRAAGVGVQLMINPIGLIGFSYGYGFDTPGNIGNKSGWQFLFHLGQQ
jgi:outer membrane protein insertion porin family